MKDTKVTLSMTYKYCKFFSCPRGTSVPDNAAFPRSLHEDIIKSLLLRSHNNKFKSSVKLGQYVSYIMPENKSSPATKVHICQGTSQTCTLARKFLSILLTKAAAMY